MDFRYEDEVQRVEFLKDLEPELKTEEAKAKTILLMTEKKV